MPMKKKRPPPSQSSKTPVSKAGTGTGEDESDSDLSALSSPSGSPALAPVAGPSTIRAPKSRSVERESDGSSALSDLDDGDEGGGAGAGDDEGDGEEDGEGERDDRSSTSETVPLDLGSDDDESELTQEEDADAEEEDEEVEELELPADEADERMELDEVDVAVKKEAVDEAVGAKGKRRSPRKTSGPNQPEKSASPAESASEDDLTPPPPTSDLVIPTELPSSPQADSQADAEAEDDAEEPAKSSPGVVPTSELTNDAEESKASDAEDDEEDDGDGDVTMRPGDVNGVLDALAEMGDHATVQDDGAVVNGEAVADAAEEDGEAEDEEGEADDTDSVTFSAIPTRLTSHSSHAPLPSPAATKALLLLEIKFAALRDRLYMERMEEAAEEEEMVLNGTHPALAYLYKTLSERREKLHEAASRKHKQVVEELARCRNNEEAAVWSWWTDERDRVHWEEFEQTWSKRRRLAREKNELETPKISKPIPRPTADRPLKLDFLSGYTPSKLSLDEATHDLALMENRRPPQHVPRTLPAVLAQYPELQAGSSIASHPHYPDDVERNPRSYAQAAASYPRQTAMPAQTYSSHSAAHAQQPQNPPARTLSNPAQVFNSLASGAPPDPGVGRQIGSSGSNTSLNRYPSNENIPPGNLLGSSTYGPPIPSPLGGLSTGTSTIGQSALGLTGRTIPTTGTSFFQPPPPPTTHAASPGEPKTLGRTNSGHENETLAQRIERERREKEDERLRERQKHFEKYRGYVGSATATTALAGMGRVEEPKKEAGGINGIPQQAHFSSTTTADAWTPTAPNKTTAPTQATELEVKRESLPATPAKSPTPVKATTSGTTKVNGNGPTTHIEIINIHDPVPSPLPTPTPSLAATAPTPQKAMTSASPVVPDPAPAATASAVEPKAPTPPTTAAPAASEPTPTEAPPAPTAAAEAAMEVEEDVSMIHPASPPSSSFEGPASVPASVGAQKDEERMDVDEEHEPPAGTKLEQMGPASAAISAT